ncbi:hypothetical protein [uncultured Winogradskyella sp.]|uniref:hypothetical protein n=1 Tax=uncultured Winogradskyella sp. TaxID=395353 RepID=UPI0026233A5C|nr:hypothetical protein [uncultured Winogradskyella sp.]
MSSKRFIKQIIPLKVWRKLDSSLREAWYYMWMTCDEAGVFYIDEDLYEFNNKTEFPLNQLKSELNDWLEFTDEKILIKAFIQVNFGEKLNPEYNPHKPLFRAIKKNNLKLHLSLNQASFKLVDEEEDVDESVDEDEDIEKAKIKKIEVKDPVVLVPELKMPFASKEFKDQWDLWKVFRKNKDKFIFLNIDSENRKLKELQNLSNNNEKTAIAIIQQSIDNGWKGLFELKFKSKGKKKFVSNR